MLGASRSQLIDHITNLIKLISHPVWSSGYDTRLSPERPGFDSRYGGVFYIQIKHQHLFYLLALTHRVNKQIIVTYKLCIVKYRNLFTYIS